MMYRHDGILILLHVKYPVIYRKLHFDKHYVYDNLRLSLAVSEIHLRHLTFAEETQKYHVINDFVYEKM